MTQKTSDIYAHVIWLCVTSLPGMLQVFYVCEASIDVICHDAHQMSISGHCKDLASEEEEIDYVHTASKGL